MIEVMNWSVPGVSPAVILSCGCGCSCTCVCDPAIKRSMNGSTVSSQSASANSGMSGFQNFIQCQ